MAIDVNPAEIIKLVKFLADHGVSDPNDYQFVVNPSIRGGLNLRVELLVTYLPNGDKTIIVLDP